MVGMPRSSCISRGAEPCIISLIMLTSMLILLTSMLMLLIIMLIVCTVKLIISIARTMFLIIQFVQ